MRHLLKKKQAVHDRKLFQSLCDWDGLKGWGAASLLLKYERKWEAERRENKHRLTFLLSSISCSNIALNTGERAEKVKERKKKFYKHKLRKRKKKKSGNHKTKHRQATFSPALVAQVFFYSCSPKAISKLLSIKSSFNEPYQLLQG